MPGPLTVNIHPMPTDYVRKQAARHSFPRVAQRAAVNFISLELLWICDDGMQRHAIVASTTGKKD
jgi:hypothetical protein